MLSTTDFQISHLRAPFPHQVTRAGAVCCRAFWEMVQEVHTQSPCVMKARPVGLQSCPRAEGWADHSVEAAGVPQNDPRPWPPYHHHHHSPEAWTKQNVLARGTFWSLPVRSQPEPPLLAGTQTPALPGAAIPSAPSHPLLQASTITPTPNHHPHPQAH